MDTSTVPCTGMNLADEIIIVGNYFSADTPDGPHVRISIVADDDDALSVAITLDGFSPVELHVATDECAPFATLLRRLPQLLQGLPLLGVAAMLL